MAKAEVAATTQAQSKPEPKPAIYRGTAITYGHAATAYTFNPVGDAITSVDYTAYSAYNPTWSHRLELAPEFHFGEQFFARARFGFAQEFTDSDDANTNHEVQLSDLAIEGGLAGWTEKFTGLHLGGNLRLTAPTSKASQFKTLVLGVGPALSLSRKFNLLSGLSLAYGGRYTYRFHRFTQAQLPLQANQSCLNAASPECQDLFSTGRRNAHSELTHGPVVSFAPLEVLSFNAAFQLSHAWLYPMAATGIPSVDGQSDNLARTATVFDLSASAQIFKPVALTLGAYTFTPGLVPANSNLSVLFNRNTTLYLDATVDIEAAVKGILGEST